jgi:hypothetical protein
MPDQKAEETAETETTAKAAAGKVATPTQPEYPSEEEINSPDQKTLILLFVIFFVTFASWGAARFACNMHPPESRAAPKLTTDKLITTAKDAAIEFVQRWRSNDFEGALEVATGDLTAEMQKGKADCQKSANECARKREAEAGRLTTAVVMKQDGFYAESKVTTTLKDKTDTYRVILQREGMVWKAATKSAE